MVGDRASQSTYDAMYLQMGLDRPIWEQFLIYIQKVLSGDFGNSFLTKRPVMGEIARAFPATLELATVAILIGTLVGVLPGIGPVATVAMLLPITSQVEPTASMIFFAGIYYGAMYGGSTTSILLNTPGETGTMVTALEGFKMAKSGRAGAALARVAGSIPPLAWTPFSPSLFPRVNARP